MTPTLELELRLARERADDFAWAFSRLVEVIAEESRKHGPQVSGFMLKLVETAVERVHAEAQLREVQSNLEFNRP